MEKILLTSINSRFSHSNLALFYLREAIIDLDYDVSLLELTINNQYSEILSEIISQQAKYICLSVYIWNVEIIKSLIIDIKNISNDVKIILGGPEVSYNSENWLTSFPQIDFIISGQGEENFRKLAINNFQSLDKIFFQNHYSFNRSIFPYKESDANLLDNKYIYYEASRGCPFRCSYCLSSRTDHNLIFKKLEQVKTELDFLCNFVGKTIKFVDRTFNAKKTFSREIWKYLISKNPSKLFHFEIYPALLEDEDFEILETCPPHLFQFEIGIQSVFSRTLRSINRFENWSKVKKNIIRILKITNIHSHLDMIVGLPFESISEIKFSFNEIYALNCDHFQVGFLKILSGTEMNDKKIEFGIEASVKAPYQILKNNWLSYDEINQLKKIELLVNLLHNSGKFSTILKSLIELYNSPFDFFSSLSDFYTINRFTFSAHDWKITGKRLIQFFSKYHSLEQDFLMDALRWDWALIVKSHYFPEFLSFADSEKIKNDGYSFLRKFNVRGQIKFENFSFNVRDLKKAIFLKIFSKRFQNQFANKNNIAVFLTSFDEKVVFFLPNDIFE